MEREKGMRFLRKNNGAPQYVTYSSNSRERRRRRLLGVKEERIAVGELTVDGVVEVVVEGWMKGSSSYVAEERNINI